MIVSTEFPPGPGGIGTHAYQLAAHLSKNGLSIYVISPQDYASEEAIRAFNQELPFSFLRLEKENHQFLNGFKRYRILRENIIRLRPSLVIATGRNLVWLASFICKQLAVPMVAVGHGLEFGEGGIRKLISRKAYNQATAVVCVSQYTRQVMWQMGIRSKNDVVIPNGADDTLFKPQQAELVDGLKYKLGVQTARILLTVGNTTSRKGQDIVIRALPWVLKEVPNVHYLIAGLPTRVEYLSHLAEAVGVVEHVHFLGSVDEEMLVCAYNACDVYVMTSRHSQDGDFEGYGIAVVEAALCGKPAIVTEESGLVEAIEPEVTGLVVPLDDPAATAVAILKLLKNDALRTQMGQQARKRALTEQTWSQRVGAYHQLLLDLTNHA